MEQHIISKQGYDHLFHTLDSINERLGQILHILESKAKDPPEPETIQPAAVTLAKALEV